MSAAGAALVLALPVSASADSLSPSTFTDTIGVGGTADISKTGVISAGTPTTAKADVLFIVDTTGSMGPAIAQVDAALASTVSALSAFGTIATGAGEYKDEASGGDAFNYQLDQAITTNSTLTQNAINAFTAEGGGDDPEQGLYALNTATTDPATGWEAGAQKIEVIVGDAPSHDASHPIAAGDVTVAGVAGTLSSNGVTLIALNASGITGDSGLDSYGQFDSTTGLLSKGVGGSLTNFTDAADITADIVAAVGAAFSTYSDVSLGLVGAAPSDCSVSLPSAITGSFSRSSAETFSFGDVGVTGTHAGVCSFTVGLFADGVELATESDTITVTGGTGATPEPSTWAMMMIGFAAFGYIGYRKRAKVTFSSLA
jgi:PEP-CTERM motif